MSKAICSECGCPIEIVNGEEWAYCPMCENDQVEVSRHKQITVLQSQLAIAEKVIELASDFIEDVTGSCPYDSELIQMQDKCIECTDDIKNCWNEYFKTKAKEMLEDE